MQRSMRELASFLIALICFSQAGCARRESHDAIVMMAVGLETVNENWEKKGRPNNFEPNSAFQSSVEHFYLFTNEIKVAETRYHCRFAVRSKLIQTPGAMAITDEGVLLWIHDKDGEVIVSPEKNGIRMTGR